MQMSSVAGWQAPPAGASAPLARSHLPVENASATDRKSERRSLSNGEPSNNPLNPSINSPINRLIYLIESTVKC